MGPQDDRNKVNTLSPAAVPPQSLRMPSRSQMGPRSPAGPSGPSAAAPYVQAFQQAGGGPRGAGAVTRTALKRTLVDAPLAIGGKVADYTKWVYSGPAAFTAGLVGLEKPQATAAPAAAPAVTPAAQPAPATQPTSTAPAKPAYWDEAQAAKTRAALQTGAVPAAPAGYTMDNVPQGGGYISWGAPMGEATLNQLAPGQRDQFRQPGSISITPERASELAKRVMTVPAESFHRPMASTDQAVAEAQAAAAARGDFEGIRRSNLSPEDRQAENEQRTAASAARAEQQRLEAMATAPISFRQSWGDMATTAANRRYARERIQQVGEERTAAANAASEAQQQAYANQIAMMNAQANQTRATAALNKPGKKSIVKVKQYDENGIVTGETPMLFDEDNPALTPMAPDLNVSEPPPAMGVGRGELVKGQAYRLNDGRIGVWDGEGFDVQ